MNDIIKISKLSTNAQIKICEQIEKKSFDAWSRYWAEKIRIKLMIKKVKNDKHLQTKTKP